MKALALLLWVEQVKGGAWADVVDVPLPVVVPCHPFGELGGKVIRQLFRSTAKKVQG